MLFLSTINAPFISILPDQSPNVMGRREVPNRPPNLTSHAYLILMNGSVKHCTRRYMLLSFVKSSRIHQRGRQPCWKGSFFYRAFPSSLKHTHKEMLNISGTFSFVLRQRKKGPRADLKAQQVNKIKRGKEREIERERERDREREREFAAEFNYLLFRT